MKIIESRFIYTILLKIHMVNFNEVSIDFLLNIGLNLTNAQKVHNVLTSHPSLVTFTQKTNFLNHADRQKLINNISFNSLKLVFKKAYKETFKNGSIIGVTQVHSWWRPVYHGPNGGYFYMTKADSFQYCTPGTDFERPILYFQSNDFVLY